MYRKNGLILIYLMCTYICFIFYTQNQQVGNRISQVNAADEDSDDSFGVIRYRLIGDDSAPTYFEIDSVTGEIKLKQSLAEDTKTEYQV